ncbi:hypothetical protein NFI96_034459, partial [Prochilodus magdalenae]
QCGSLSWATCDESSCECYISLGEGERQFLNCTTSKLIPKCFLMKAEMYRLQHPSAPHYKSTETALADTDELYDPDCEPSGLFRAKQCNNTDVCWCVDSAGVRRSDKGDRNLRCEGPVETNLVDNPLIHKDTSVPLQSSQLHRYQDILVIGTFGLLIYSAVANALQERYYMDHQLVSKVKVKYDVDVRLIVLDEKSDIGDGTQDLSGLAYYMEKDVETLLDDQIKLGPTEADQKMERENALMYYEKEKKPTGGTQRLTVGILTVIGVVTLTGFVGLLVLFLIRRQKRGKYEKAQTNEIEEI